MLQGKQWKSIHTFIHITIDLISLPKISSNNFLGILWCLKIEPHKLVNHAVPANPSINYYALSANL